MMIGTLHRLAIEIHLLAVVRGRNIPSNFLIFIGITLGVIASVITSLGVNLQKLSLGEKANDSAPSWVQHKWIAGFICIVVGSLIDFMAFGLAPQSLLAPLAGLSLVWNLFIASSLLKEKYSVVDIVAVLLIFFGTGLAVSFASHTQKDFTFTELKELCKHPRMHVYSVAVPFVLLFHYLLIRVGGSNKLHSEKLSKYCEIAGYGGFSGIAGGQSALFAKITAELIKDAYNSDPVFQYHETYAAILLMFISLATQIAYLNKGLKRFDSLQVIPVYQSYWIISGVLGGFIFFGEIDDISNAQIIWFCVGTLITLSGLFVLATKDHPFTQLDTHENPNIYFPTERFGSDEYERYELDEMAPEDSIIANLECGKADSPAQE